MKRLIITIIVAALAFSLIACTSEPVATPDEGSTDIPVTEETVNNASEDNVSEVAQKDTRPFTDQDSIEIPGFESLEISADADVVSLPFANPKDNKCDLQISLCIGEDADNGEVIYTSEKLAPGESVGEVKLSRSLKAGEYEVVVRYQAFTSGSDEALNGADISTSMIVK